MPAGRQLSRPHILLSGALDVAGGVEGHISCEDDLRRVHRLRERYDAVAVGARTFAVDRSRLTARDEHLGRRARAQPWRVVFAGRSVVADVHAHGANLVVVGEQPCPEAECWIPGPARALSGSLHVLTKIGIRTVMLEGGPTLWRAALAEGVVDDIEMFVATKNARVAVARIAKVLGLPRALLRSSPGGAGQVVTGAFTPAPRGHSKNG